MLLYNWLIKLNSRCAEGKPESIRCKANPENIELDGTWVDYPSGVELSEEELADYPCECPDLRIPADDDTFLVCDTQHSVNENGDYIVRTVDDCELICGSEVTIPIECRFNPSNYAYIFA